MEPTELIHKIEEFIEATYLKELMRESALGRESLAVDFAEVSRYSPDIADMLLETPDEVLKAFELTLQKFDIEKVMKARIFNLPREQKVLIRNIRSEHLSKLLMIEGTVRQKSDVRPQVTSARFECPSCGNVLNVLQLDSKFKEPSRCGCGRKGKFRLLSKELVDAQGIVLEEHSRDIEGGAQPKRMNVLLKGELVSPISERRTNPGSTIRINGSVKEVPIILRTGGQSTKFDLIIEANNVEPLDEDYTNIEVASEDEAKIREIASDKDVVRRLARSLAPSIYGHDKIKEALCLQFVGGVKKERTDGVQSRADIHVLLIGDPGAGKSMLLKRAAVVAPKSRYVSGKGVSGAGLTAAVVKDEFLSGWSLEAGALVLANNGVVMIDELDKMSQDDTAAMHEGLEQQSISISKANIQATLRCETTVLAAANPKFGRFDPYETIAKQIDLPPTLINRFDLIFTIKDMPDEEKDEMMAGFILSLHKSPTNEKPDIDTDLLRKYFVFARQKAKPKLTSEAVRELKDYYIKMRGSGSDDGGIKSIPISPRQLEALVRLSEAAAKLRLADKVTTTDAKRAIGLLHYCLEQVGLDPDTGRIDIDRITTGVTSSERNRLMVIKEIINELEEKGEKVIPLDSVIAAAQDRGISESDVDDAIQKLKRSGDLFEPRRNHISKI